MNKERLIQIAELLENEAALYKLDFEFYMPTFLAKMPRQAFGNKCGTAGCIAGLAYVVALNETKTKARFPLERQIVESAQSYLGLTAQQAEFLFTPMLDEYDGAVWYNDGEYTNSIGDNITMDLCYVEAAQAAKVVRHLVETGEVDWTIVADELWENATKS